jgi:hypothetical protein
MEVDVERELPDVIDLEVFDEREVLTTAVDLDRDEGMSTVRVEHAQQVGARHGQRYRLDSGAVDHSGQKTLGPELPDLAAAPR